MKYLFSISDTLANGLILSESDLVITYLGPISLIQEL